MKWADEHSATIWGIIHDDVYKLNPVTGKMENMFGRLYIKGTYTLPDGRTVTNPIVGIDISPFHANYIDFIQTVGDPLGLNKNFKFDPNKLSGWMKALWKASGGDPDKFVGLWWAAENNLGVSSIPGFTQWGKQLGKDSNTFIIGWKIYDAIDPKTGQYINGRTVYDYTQVMEWKKKMGSDYVEAEIEAGRFSELAAAAYEKSGGKMNFTLPLSGYKGYQNAILNMSEINKAFNEKYGSYPHYLWYDAASEKWYGYSMKDKKWYELTVIPVDKPSEPGALSVTRFTQKNFNWDPTKGLTPAEGRNGNAFQAARNYLTKQGIENVIVTDMTQKGNYTVITYLDAQDRYHKVSVPLGYGPGREATHIPGGVTTGSSHGTVGGGIAWELWPSLELQPSRFKTGEEKT